VIVDQLSQWKNYFTGSVWKTIFDELTALNENTPEMEKKVRGDDIILKVFSYTTLDPRDDQAELESHRIYLDIHTSITNAERIEWFPVDSLKVIKPYDERADEIYYAKPQSACAGIVMTPGLFALFGPNDAHMPRLYAAGKPLNVKKAVMKIRIDLPF
jgi:YhcH/YjgK/YiaL family protein